MTTETPRAAPSDAQARQLALDPTRSYIVQAPAGSGKTTLLTQRYLSLLAHAARPEEILAITFTRKAAAEMRGRVLIALESAAAAVPARDANEQRTRVLALAALAQDERQGWGLLEDPGRLRIQTFDALNQWLAGRLPILAGTGAAPTVSTEPGPLYALAATRTVGRLEDDDALADALAVVLGWLDNDVPGLVGLLSTMLQKRDHWLRHLARDEFVATPDAVREILESSLSSVVGEGLARAHAAWPVASRRTLVAKLKVVAARATPDEDDGTPSWRALAADAEDLSADPATLVLWQRALALVLKLDGDWRATIDKRQGFPVGTPAEREAKRAMLEYLQSLAGQDELLAALQGVRELPPAGYTQPQWTVLRAIVEVLQAAASELEVVFAERGEVDFVAVSRAALLALGREAEPSDFALRLDYRLRHLLVDEFQDTSAGQVALLERLTEGFVPGDGRTLFCVGDPMQSVYRFREADVALFLKVRDQGLGSLALTSLVLERNFRSQPALVEWVNETFARVFPARDDLRAGAVRHARATPGERPPALPGVHLHPLPGALPLDEGERVAELVATLRAAQPAASIAVLGRARSHLSGVARALSAADIAFQGLALVKLKDRLAVRDLVSLTRAVCHVADRDAWLGCLRAPFTGLGLGELYALLEGEPRATVRELATDPSRLAALAPDARARLTRTIGLLDAARAERGRRSLATCIETLWLALGGPATLADPADLANASAFFARLDTLQHGGDLVDPVRLETELDELYAAPDPAADGKLQLMTIHHAKGLEWDIVVLVGLDRTVAGDRMKLLHWQSWEREHGRPALVLAPVRARARLKEPLLTWLTGLERTRAEHELARLLYVATTRAIHELHLVGSLAVAEDGSPKPATSGSALKLLEPAIGVAWAAEAARRLAAVPPAPAAPAGAPPGGGEQRLASDWQPPAPPPRLRVGRIAPAHTTQPEFVWVSEPARHAGTIVHEELARRARDPAWRADDSRIRRRLRELGLEAADLGVALGRVKDALQAIDADPRGQWMLAGPHRQAACELALSGTDGDELVSVVIDRTFVDAHGVRWIIDYKTSTHEGAGLESFLDEEQRRYHDQLERYARLMRRYDPAHPLRLGLYFPLLGAWREWEPAAE